MIVYLKIWLISFETSHVVLKKCFQKPMIEASLSCFCLQRECFQGCHVTDNICCKFLANSFYQIKEYSSNPGLVRFIILKEYYILLKAFSVSLMRRVKFISSLSLLRSFSFFLSMKHEFYWIAFLHLLIPHGFSPLIHVLVCFHPPAPSRYKMISEFTWPNHDLPSDKEAVKKLVEYCGFQDDVAYGKTKIFIRTPRTLFTLEELRAQMLVRIVLFLQKVILHFLYEDKALILCS